MFPKRNDAIFRSNKNTETCEHTCTHTNYTLETLYVVLEWCMCVYVTNSPWTPHLMYDLQASTKFNIISFI